MKLTIKEPVRTQQPVSDNAEKPSVKKSIKLLLSIPTWWGMCLGISFASFGNYAISTWLIDFYVRVHPDYPIRDLLIAFGIINGTAYALGVWLGGAVADKWGKHDRRAYALLPAIMLILGVPAFYFTLQVESVMLSLGLITIFLFTSGSYLGPSFAMAQTLAPVNVRAMSTALFFFVLNIIALGGGPTLVGIFSQSMVPELGETVALTTALEYLVVMYVLAILVFLWTSTRIRKDWQLAEERGH